MKIFLLIFISIILVTSVTLAINHPSFGYGGGGGGGGSGGGRILDPRVCGDKLCSEIPGGRSAWEANIEPIEQERKKISLHLSPRQQVKNGIDIDQVICKEGLVLFIKYNDSPACVRPETSLTLEQRSWGGFPSNFSIDSFEECIAAGNPAMESYPRQCRTSDGKHFVENIPGQEQCQLSGGLWGIWGNAVPSSAECNPSTSDQGKECTDSTQCQSFCQAKEGSEINSEDTGMCYGYELAICMQEVQNGVVQPEWCQ